MWGELPRDELQYQDLYKELNIDAQLKVEGSIELLLAREEGTELQPSRRKRLITRHATIKPEQAQESLPMARNSPPPPAPVSWDYNLPSDSELPDPTMYNLDLQDMAFLGIISAQYDLTLPATLFEQCMAFLEQEMLKLDLKIPLLPDESPTGIDEDGCCAVCQDPDSESGNAILFCDNCNVAAHQECYDIKLIPEGIWLCRTCANGIEPTNKRCILCPWRSGVLSPVEQHGWAHILCAMLVPELYTKKRSLDMFYGHNQISPDRWNLRCTICKEKGGACIQCCWGKCVTAFHVSCGIEAGLLQYERPETGLFDAILDSKPYCPRHVPGDWHKETAEEVRQQLRQEISEIEKEVKDNQGDFPFWRHSGVMLIPNSIVMKLCEVVKAKHKQDMSRIGSVIARYWVLKHQEKGSMYSRKLRLTAERLKTYYTERESWSIDEKQQEQEEILRLLESARKVRQILTGKAQ